MGWVREVRRSWGVEGRSELRSDLRVDAWLRRVDSFSWVLLWVWEGVDVVVLEGSEEFWDDHGLYHGIFGGCDRGRAWRRWLCVTLCVMADG